MNKQLVDKEALEVLKGAKQAIRDMKADGKILLPSYKNIKKSLSSYKVEAVRGV